MKMEDALTGVRTLVHHQPVASRRQPNRFRHVTRREQEMTEHLHIGGRGVMDAHDVLLGNDEQVRGGDGSYVPAGENVIVLEQDLRGSLSSDDVAEEAACRHGRARVSRSRSAREDEALSS